MVHMALRHVVTMLHRGVHDSLVHVVGFHVPILRDVMCPLAILSVWWLGRTSCHGEKDITSVGVAWGIGDI